MAVPPVFIPSLLKQWQRGHIHTTLRLMTFIHTLLLGPVEELIWEAYGFTTIVVKRWAVLLTLVRMYTPSMPMPHLYMKEESRPASQVLTQRRKGRIVSFDGMKRISECTKRENLMQPVIL